MRILVAALLLALLPLACPGAVDRCAGNVSAIKPGKTATLHVQGDDLSLSPADPKAVGEHRFRVGPGCAVMLDGALVAKERLAVGQGVYVAADRGVARLVVAWTNAPALRSGQVAFMGQTHIVLEVEEEGADGAMQLGEKPIITAVGTDAPAAVPAGWQVRTHAGLKVPFAAKRASGRKELPGKPPQEVVYGTLVQCEEEQAMVRLADKTEVPVACKDLRAVVGILPADPAELAKRQCRVALWYAGAERGVAICLGDGRKVPGVVQGFPAKQ